MPPYVTRPVYRWPGVVPATPETRGVGSPGILGIGGVGGVTPPRGPTTPEGVKAGSIGGQGAAEASRAGIPIGIGAINAIASAAAPSVWRRRRRRCFGGDS